MDRRPVRDAPHAGVAVLGAAHRGSTTTSLARDRDDSRDAHGVDVSTDVSFSRRARWCADDDGDPWRAARGPAGRAVSSAADLDGRGRDRVWPRRSVPAFATAGWLADDGTNRAGQ